MVGYNAKKRKKYCDLFCYNCEGFGLKECLFNQNGHHMRLLRAICMAEQKFLFEFEPREGFWAEHVVLTPQIVGSYVFPFYPMETVH